MSWLDDISSGISDFFGISSDWGKAAVGLGTRLVTVTAVSSLIGNRAQQNEPPSTPPAGTSTKVTGTQVSLDVNSNNKLSVVYGEAFVGSSMIDAKISTDQTTTWYVHALAETTDNGTYVIGDLSSPTTTNIIWGDKQMIFGDPVDRTKVTKLINGNGEEDVSISGYMYVYLYPNGVDSGTNTGGVSAVDVLSTTEIPADARWNSSRYTTDGLPTMKNTCFAIVKLIYNQDAGVTNSQQFRALLTNPITRPGDVLLDYFTNSRYGCGIDVDKIDVTSLYELNSYSDELITYTPVGGGTAEQPRYRIDGAVDTGSPCLSNLQQMVDSCDSWLKWDEVHGRWSVVPNRSYTDTQTYNDLFVVSSQNLTSGITISPTDLNSTYNVIESHFTNYKIQDNRDFNFVYLPNEDKNPNEVVNKLVIDYQLINDSVQAKYLATRRLIQCREDLVINFDMDYSGIQINAGDVIRVRHEAYGWGPTHEDPTALDKLFRVDQVQEEKTTEGTLGVRITAFEYNDQVFQNIDIQDYDPAANTGLSNPAIVGTPTAPTFENLNLESGTFDVVMTIPSPGQIIAVEFWYGPTLNIENNNYKLWDTQFNGTTPVYPIGAVERSTVVGFQPGDYYWKIRCLTQTTKSDFSSSGSVTWSPAQPATRKNVSDNASTAITYSNPYYLWSPNTRAEVLSIDYVPAETGSDIGGKDTNQIEVTFQAQDYTSGSPDGLLVELWASIQQSSIMYNITKGTNGYVIPGGETIFWTGAINTVVPTPTLSEYRLALNTAGQTYSCAATNGTIYVVGGMGMIVGSYNGYENWSTTSMPTAASTVQFNDIIYANSTFIAVGGRAGDAYICTSTDGITWTERLLGTVSTLTSIAYNGSKFVAMGANFSYAESTDGITWTANYVAGGSSISIGSVTYNSTNSSWFAAGYMVSGGQLYAKIYKLVGSSWTPMFTSTSPGSAFTAITSATSGSHNYMYAVGLNGLVMSTNDSGSTWYMDSFFNDATDTYWMVKVVGDDVFFLGQGNSFPAKLAYTVASPSLAEIRFAITERLQAFGSSPNTPFDTSLQSPQNRLTNNVITLNTFRTGLYLKNVPMRYYIVVGDLQNPTTPSTVYAGRKSIALTEYKG